MPELSLEIAMKFHTLMDITPQMKLARDALPAALAAYMTTMCADLARSDGTTTEGIEPA